MVCAPAVELMSSRMVSPVGSIDSATRVCAAWLAHTPLSNKRTSLPGPRPPTLELDHAGDTQKRTVAGAREGKFVWPSAPTAGKTQIFGTDPAMESASPDQPGTVAALKANGRVRTFV